MSTIWSVLAFISGGKKTNYDNPRSSLMHICGYVTEFCVEIHVNDLGECKEKQS